MKLIRLLYSSQFFAKCLLSVLLISISGCNLFKRVQSNSIITVMIDSNNLMNMSAESIEDSLQLELYILSKHYLIESKENKRFSEISKILDMAELSRYKTSLYYMYHINPDETIRDTITIAPNAALLLLVLKKGGVVLSKKTSTILAKKIKTFSIELTGTNIRINN
jgi:hypothetical protein